jgi:hypothetical protein
MKPETPAVDYNAVLADIEARIARLQTAAETVREILSAAGGPSNGSSPGGGPPGSTRPDAFLGKSIPDATKKHLETVREKQSTQAVIDALAKGGLPRAKYSTVYAILRRREKQVGDIINMKGDWALQEWYPNYRKAKAVGKDGENGDTAPTIEKPAKATKAVKKATA